MKLPFTALDYVAIAWFFVIWVGYQFFARWRAGKGHPSLCMTAAVVTIPYLREFRSEALMTLDPRTPVSIGKNGTRD